MTLVTRKIRRIAKALSGLSIQNPNPYLDGSLEPMKIGKPQPIKSNLLQKIGIKAKAGISAAGNAIGTGAKAIGNFVKDNPDLVKAGINSIGENFGEDVELGGNAAAFLDVANIVGQLPGVAGVVGTAVAHGMNIAGEAFGSKVQYSPNQNVMRAVNSIGGSYGGTTDLIKDAANNNSTYFLNRTGRKKAKQRRSDAIQQGEILANINTETQNRNARYSLLNDIAFHTKQLGGFDRTVGFIKQGGILDKIDKIKARQIFKVINTKPLEIVEQPIRIEEFKKGGIISLTEDWEPQFVIEFEDGGKITKKELEEFTQQNVIPEGALHKNKHHMENAEGLTEKGIPVIDNDGNQLAEIEKEEWTMTLELTNVIEDLYKQFYSDDVTKVKKDELAIEAGKIIVNLLLYNTDDRVGLLDRIE